MQIIVSMIHSFTLSKVSIHFDCISLPQYFCPLDEDDDLDFPYLPFLLLPLISVAL